MAEDLGEITIKFGEGGPAAPRGGGAGPTVSHRQAVADATKSAMSAILQNIPAITRVAQAGMQGGTIGTVASATRMAAGGIAAAGLTTTAVLAPMLAIAAGVGIVAVAVVAIRSYVSGIMDRVGQLANVSGPMALQEATNRLSEMRRDMREAQILGPMYTQVSQLVNKIKDLLQPFLMAFRAALLSVIIPILEQVVKYLQSLFNLIPVIAMALSQSAGTIQSVGGMGGVFKAISRAGMGVGGMGTQVGGLFGVLSWLFPPSKTSGAANTLNTIASVLMRFYQSFQNQQQHSGGRWALDTLNTLATGGLVNVPGVPGLMPIRTAPARRARSGGQVP